MRPRPLACLALAVLTVALVSVRSAAAQVSREGIVGSWTAAAAARGDGGDAPPARYDLFADGRYTFDSGRTEGAVRHAGTWQLEPGGRVLRLRARERVVVRGGTERTLRADRVFRLPVAPTGGTSIRIAGVDFVR